MGREHKAAFIEELQGQLAESPLVILTEFKGSTVSQLDAVRRAAEEHEGLSFRVVKNTLSIPYNNIGWSNVTIINYS